MNSNAKKAATALIYTLAAILISFVCNYSYDQDFIRYTWLAVVFWVTASSMPKIAFGFIFKTDMQPILLPAVLVIIATIIYTGNGFNFAKFGLGVGITFSVAILLQRWLLKLEAKRWYSNLIKIKRVNNCMLINESPNKSKQRLQAASTLFEALGPP